MVVLEALVKLAQRRQVLWLHSIFHGDFTPPLRIVLIIRILITSILSNRHLAFTARHGHSMAMESLIDLPGHLIRRLNQSAVAAFNAEVKSAGFDLTPVQYGSLATIYARPGIDQATLAGLVAYDSVTIGGVVARLESRGYLTRSISQNDRRARFLNLTPRGESVVLTIQPALRAAQAQILNRLSEDERPIFMRMLRKLTLNPQEYDEHIAADQAAD